MRHTGAAGIYSGVRKSKRSEAPEDGTGEVPHALSLRSAESGMHKAFLMNRSGARPEVLRNAYIFHAAAAARRTHMPHAQGFFRPFKPKKLPRQMKNPRFQS